MEKSISVTCYNSGLAKVCTEDFNINNENNASLIKFDFTNTAYLGENKWVDIVLPDGTSLRYDLGPEDYIEFSMEYPVTVAGEMTITPFVYDGINKIKYRADQTVLIYEVLEAGNQAAVERDDFIFDLEQRVKALEEEEQDMDVNIIGSVPLDVNVQDQATPAINAKLSLLLSETTVVSGAVINTKTMVVADATNYAVGNYVSVFNVEANRFYLGTITAVSGTTITLDIPFNFSYPAGSITTVGRTNINVDGSITPVTFKLRNTTERIAAAFDITRFIFAGLTSEDPEWHQFGDQDELSEGLVARKVDGETNNLWVVKNNNEFANIMYDFDLYTVAKNAQSGFKGRLTYGGQSKIGVVVRLSENDDLEIIVQDDLTGLQKFEIVAQGHLVQE